MEIGSLTGVIELDDKMSSALVLVSNKVQRFAANFENAFGAIAVGALGAVTAITAISGTITAMASRGSTILGVEESFNRLAKAAGTTGDVLINSLSKGVHGTVDSMELMQITSKALSAGVKLSGDDMRVLGETARALGRASGTDATQGLATLTNALVTGRTRALSMAGVVVDVEGAEKRLAKQLNTTREHLSQAGRVEAARTAIMEASRAKLEQLGVAETSFKEKIQASRVTIGNWFDDLVKAIASSSNVNRALDAIGAAFVRAFGNGTGTVLEIIVRWVNRFADVMASYGPMIIQTVADIGSRIYDIWQTVLRAWNSVPDWFKEVAKEAVIAGVAVGVVHQGMTLLSGSDLLTTIASFATIWSGFGKGILAAIPIVKNFVLAMTLVYQLGGVAGILTAIGDGILAVAGSALGLPVVIAAAAFALYRMGEAIGKLWDMWKRGEPMWNFFGKGGGFWDNSIIGRWLGMSKAVDGVADSLDRATTAMKNWNGAYDKFDLPQKTDNQAAIDDAAARQKRLTDQQELDKKLQAEIAKAAELRSKTLAEEWAERSKILNEGGFYTNALGQTIQSGGQREIEFLAKQWQEEENMLRASEDEKLRIVAEKWQARQKILDQDPFAEEIKHYNEVEQFSKAALAAQAAEHKRIYAEMARHPDKFSKDTIEHFKEVAEEADRLAKGLKKSLASDLKDDLTQIPGMIAAGFTGGGGFGGALKGIGTMLSSTLGKHIGQGITSLGKFGGPIGEAIGSLAGPLIDMFGKLFSTAGRDMVREFSKTFGGFDALHARLLTAGAAGEQMWVALTQGVGRGNAEQAKAAIDQVTQFLKAQETAVRAVTGRMKDLLQMTPAMEVALGRVFDAKNPEAYLKALEDMNGVLDAQAAKEKFLDDTLKKYGLTWKDTGEKARMAFAAGKARDFTSEFEALKEAGVDINNIWRHMGDNVSDFALEAAKSGTELPEKFKGVLQTALDAGELFSVSTDELDKMRKKAEELGQPFDENKYKIHDLSELGLTFGRTMEEATDRVAEAVERLAKVFEERLGPAIAGIGGKYVDVSGMSNAPNYGGQTSPVYEAGGGVIYAARGRVIPFVPRGSDTVPVMATPGEEILSPAESARYRNEQGRPMVVEMHVDGRVLARASVPYIPGEVARVVGR